MKLYKSHSLTQLFVNNIDSNIWFEYFNFIRCAYLVVKTETFEKIRKAVNAKDAPTVNDISPYIVDPHSLHKLPDFTVCFNHRKFVMTAKDYTIKYNGTYYLAINPLDGFGDLWILGDTFMRRFYTVFDYHGQDGPQVRICKSINH